MCKHHFLCFCLLPAGEHVGLWSRPLFPPVSLHFTARSAASALPSRQPTHSLSTALILFSTTRLPFSPPKLLSYPKSHRSPPSPASVPLRPPSDIVIGTNGTSHGKVGSLNVALPNSLQFVSLSDNCRTRVLSQSTLFCRRWRRRRSAWIIEAAFDKRKQIPHDRSNNTLATQAR